MQPRASSNWPLSSASAAPALSARTALSKRVPRTSPEIGRAAASICANCIREKIPRIEGHETNVVIHNDAVVQGLSELPNMQEFQRWGVLTVGTGLGNARFTNRREAPDSD